MPKPKNKLQTKWIEILFPYHKHMWMKAYKKLRTKISGYKTTLGIDVEEKIIESYGQECIYCDRILKVGNISVDHRIPTFRGGENTQDNLFIVCNRCNRRKGILTHIEYMDILMYLQNKSEIVRDYVLRKLASKDWGDKI